MEHSAESTPPQPAPGTTSERGDATETGISASGKKILQAMSILVTNISDEAAAEADIRGDRRFPLAILTMRKHR
jgi:hypothetical protein